MINLVIYYLNRDREKFLSLNFLSLEVNRYGRTV